jgi:N-acetylglucosamine kinase-like BadF-type ATPase
MTHKLLLGVDGGGSRTRVIIADEAGSVLGVGEAGAGNYQSVGFAAATHEIVTAIRIARMRAQLDDTSPFAAACFGLAGAGRPDDQQRFKVWAAQQNITSACVCVSDAELVLAAGTPAGWGAALICGTGSCCWARAADGRSVRIGGWGYLLGDEGGGYDLAVRTLRLATQTADGRAAAHTILATVLEHWRLTASSDLIRHVYRAEMSRAEVADVSRRVLDLADTGDTYAIQLLDDSARSLALLLTTAVRRLDLHEPPVALAGGILGASRMLRSMVYEHAEISLGPVVYVDDPAQGAIRLAQELYTTLQTF